MAWGLYELLSPMIGLGSDGTVSAPVNVPPLGSGYGITVGCFSGSRSSPGELASAFQAACSAVGPISVTCTTTSCNWTWSGSMAGAGSSSGDVTYSPGTSCQEGYSYGAGQCTSNNPGTKTPTEAELTEKIQNSPATPADLFDKTLKDTIREGFTNKDVGLIPETTPAAVSAEPVTGPSEVVKTQTSPNPDGSTTTTTSREQTTATPRSRGVTVGDSGVDWETTTTTTETETNNTSGETKTRTTSTNTGTTTTSKPASDLCLDHPEILACSQLGDIPADTPTPVTSQPLNVTFTPPASVAGTCPAPITKTLSGGFQVVQSFTPVCDFAGMMRPVVIAAAFLGAAFIVSGSVRVDS